MSKPRTKRVVVPIGTIWPQPKTNPREVYKYSYPTGRRLPNGKPQRKTIGCTTDLESTVEMVTAICSRLSRARAGLSSAGEDRYAEQDQITTVRHLADWRQSMVDAGRDPRHVRQFHDNARDVLIGTPPAIPGAKRGRGSKPAVALRGCGANRVSEIMPSAVMREVGKIKAERSAATANRYMNAVDAFLNWGVSDTRWRENVCAHLTRYSVSTDRRRERRAVPLADVYRLIEATESGAVHAGRTGYQRSLIYRTCLCTALRAKQARGLKVSDLVTGERSGVWAQAVVAKNKKKSFKPIPVTLADELAVIARGKQPNEPLLDVPTNTARMLRHDLTIAGVPYRTADGYFDFHGIRHTSGALLVSAGVPIKAVQEHMGHSTIRMTLDTYGHVMDDDRRRVAAALPDFEQARRLDRRLGGSERLSMSLDVSEERQRTAMAGKKTRLEDWSHGESNPDLLNAIQQIDLRKSSISKGIYKTIGDPQAPGAARRARKKIRTALAGMFRKDRRRRSAAPTGKGAQS